MALTQHLEQTTYCGSLEKQETEVSKGISLTTFVFIPLTDEEFPITTPVFIGLKAMKGGTITPTISLPRYDVQLDVPFEYYPAYTSVRANGNVEQHPGESNNFPFLFVHPHWMAFAKQAVINNHPELEHVMNKLFEDQGIGVIERLNRLYLLVRRHPTTRNLCPPSASPYPQPSHNHHW